ncbi:hypothetical protein ACKLNO_09410 [Neisseriaceae bacterium B1]
MWLLSFSGSLKVGSKINEYTENAWVQAPHTTDAGTLVLFKYGKQEFNE